MSNARGVWLALSAVVLLGSSACGSDDADDGASSTSNTGTPSSSAASGTGGSGAASSGAGGEGATGGASDGGGGSSGIGGSGGASGNQAPSVTILQPVDGSTFAAFEAITVQATVTDPEEGTIPNEELPYYASGIVDPIGFGQGPFNVSFDVAGDYTITLTATDHDPDDPKSTTASVQITITAQ